jgi:hypothetical protein
MKPIPFFIIFVEMINIMKDFERQLIDFLKYIKEVHTDEYGNLQICDDGDEYDPIVERVVKDYMKKNNIISDWLDKYGDPEIDKKVEKELERMTNKEGPNLENLGNISSTDLSPEFQQLVNDNWGYLIGDESKKDEPGKYFADNADVIITMERPKEGTHYNFIIQNDKYKMLLAMQTYPETKYYFKDDEISVEELILKLDNGDSSEIKYSEDEVRELLIKGLTHNDDKFCGSLVTVQKEIRTANFNVWFEENKKK